MNQKKLRDLFEYHSDGYFIAKTRRAIRRPAGEKVMGCSTGGRRNYLSVMVEGKKFGIHRLIFLWHHGHLPEEIDHIDRNRQNNRIENLRAADSTLNRANIGPYKNNRSGFRGVYTRPNGTFNAVIKCRKKRFFLGTFKTAKDAAGAYNEKAKELFGEFAFINPL